MLNYLTILRAFQRAYTTNIVRCPESVQRGLKTQNGRFPPEFRLYLKFLCVNNVSDKFVRHSLAYLSVQKWFAGVVPYYVKIYLKLTKTLQKPGF